MSVSTYPKSASSLPPCVGRDAELASLTSLYEDAAAHGERLALVEGPTGVGKSRILREFRSRARLAGGAVLEGKCEPGRAFGPFSEIVDHAIRFLAEVGREPAGDMEALACAQGCHRYWWQHGATLAGVSPSAVAEDPQLFALEKRLRFFDAIRALLWQVAEVRPPVVMIHELDRADRGTFVLLRFLLDEGSVPWTTHMAPERTLRALFVACLRTDVDTEESELLAAIRKLDATHPITVGRLNDEGIRAYLQSPETIARVLERTGGMPEAIDQLLEGAPLAPGTRVRTLLGNLSPQARTLIDALAVFDGPADVDLLVRLAGKTVETAGRGEFAQCELVTQRVVDGTLLFTFQTQRDREHAYGLVDEGRRRDTHARIATHFADQPGQEAVASRHALLAGDFERAVPMALAAAHSLSISHAHAEAAVLLESVLDRVPTPNVDVLESLAELYRTSGEYARALEHARTVSHLQPESPRAARRVGQLLILSGSLDEATSALEDARRLAVSTNDDVAAAEVDTLLAEVHYQRGAYADAREWAERALAEAGESDNAQLQVHARNTLGRLALMQGKPADGLALFEHNLTQSVEAGLAHQEAQALTNMGVARLHLRDFKGAEVDFTRALAVAGAADTRDHAIAMENLAVLAHWQRDFATAQARYYDAVTLLKRLGNRDMLARVANNLGELYVAMGDPSRARTLCEFAAQVGGPTLSVVVVAEGLLLRGRIEAAVGHTAAAHTAWNAAADRFRGIADRRAAVAARELARLALTEGDVVRARAYLADVPETEVPKDAAEAAIIRADLERAEGGQSLPHARKAVALAESAKDDLVLLPALLSLTRALVDAEEISEAAKVMEAAQAAEARLTEKVPEDCLTGWTQRADRAELTRIDAELTAAWSGKARPRRTSKQPSSPPPTGAETSLRPNWRGKYTDIVGQSEAITTVLGVLDKVAPSDAMVLIRGESGTGKELVAAAIHANSPRRDKPLVKVNCAALVETLLLSEFFGHEKGAFTGAAARKKGRFELADGGTIFLDEIGDISPKTQVALLRVLQEHEFERVGGTQAIKVDVRIVAATHRDLEQMVRDGLFREDLYYRLRGIMVRMPALRERLTDLPALSRYLLDRIAAERGEPAKSISDEALTLLRSHHWPGNVRELENVLRSATLFAERSVLEPLDFAAFAATFEPAPQGPTEQMTVTASDSDAPPANLEETIYNLIRGGDHSLLEMKKVIEKECILRALQEADGNITRAATLLGMKRPRLSQLVKQYGLGNGIGEITV